MKFTKYNYLSLQCMDYVLDHADIRDFILEFSEIIMLITYYFEKDTEKLDFKEEPRYRVSVNNKSWEYVYDSVKIGKVSHNLVLYGVKLGLYIDNSIYVSSLLEILDKYFEKVKY